MKSAIGQARIEIERVRIDLDAQERIARIYSTSRHSIVAGGKPVEGRSHDGDALVIDLIDSGDRLFGIFKNLDVANASFPK
jgi:hypothetical protein